MTLAFLAGYRPLTFGSVVDGPEPYCTACGEAVGIFLGHGAEWHHFRVASAVPSPDDGPTEVYDTDHAPSIGWRCAASRR